VGATRTIELARPLDLGATLGPMRRGRGDPCLRIEGRNVWRATRTPDGPASIHLHHVAADRVDASAWGPGAGWAMEHAPDLIGEHDDISSFDALLADLRGPDADLVRRLHRAEPGLRMPRSFALAETMVPVVLEQRVTSQSARWSHRGLVQSLGEPAPAVPGLAVVLMLPPDPTTLATLADWAFHRHNVDARRAGTIRRIARRAPDLDAARTLEDARRRLLAISGVGLWSMAEGLQTALGDADAVSVGDYHLPHHVAFALRGRRRGDDDLLLELLEPFRGHRARVCRLVLRGCPAPPRQGPKQRHRDITRH
jgi:3-methyladenine DNA glycosylase/8-oxoguanine DNA glycosylase